jgi:hypothetical protein
LLVIGDDVYRQGAMAPGSLPGGKTYKDAAISE